MSCQYIRQSVTKDFGSHEWCKGTIEAYFDDGQLWRVVYDDLDEEDFSCADMLKVMGSNFKCGLPTNNRSTPVTSATQVREQNRHRRLYDRRDPLDGVVEELQDVTRSAEFELPKHYVLSAGTKWRLLRVYYDSNTGSQLAAYCPVDEADAIPSEDIAALSLQDLEREYDIEVAQYDKVQAWIAASKDTAAVAVATEGLRRSRRQRGDSL